MAQFISRNIGAEATALFCGTFPGAVAVNTTRLDTNIQALHHGGKINLAGFFFIFNFFSSVLAFAMADSKIICTLNGEVGFTACLTSPIE